MYIYQLRTPDEGYQLYIMTAYKPRRREVRLTKLAKPWRHSAKTSMHVELFEKRITEVWVSTPARMRKRYRKWASGFWTDKTFVTERVRQMAPWYDKAEEVEYTPPGAEDAEAV